LSLQAVETWMLPVMMAEAVAENAEAGVLTMWLK